MTTAVDTNVVIALWDKDPALNAAAQNALEAAFNRGTLVAAAPVFAQLIAAPRLSEAFIGSFFEETGIVLIGSYANRCGELPGELFKSMQSADVGSAIRGRAVFLPTS